MESWRSFPLHFLDGGLFAFVTMGNSPMLTAVAVSLTVFADIIWFILKAVQCYKFHFLTEKGAQRSQVFHPKSHSENDQEPEFKSRFGILQRASLPPPLPFPGLLSPDSIPSRGDRVMFLRECD